MADVAQQVRSALRLTRRQGGLVAALLAYAGVLIAALLTGSEIGVVNRAVEGAAAASSLLLGDVASVLPLGYAFGAGMVAAVNPCGFAMLPAYLGFYLGAGEGAHAAPAALGGPLVRALRVSATVTVGFVVLFGMAGLGLALASSLLAQVLPWVGLVVGVLLVWLGGRLLGGDQAVYAALGERLADRVGQQAGEATLRGYFAYGLAYGLASLSCTLPIFLTVVGTALTAQGFLRAALQFALYGLGMGLVVTLLTLSVALFQQTAVVRTRQLLRYVQPASAALLLLAGAYITYYWLTLGGLLARLGVA